jgi:phospholipid transport system substrate-binding protein
MKIKIKLLILLYLSVFVFISVSCFAEISPMTCLKENFNEVVETLKSDSFKNMEKKAQQDKMYELLNSSFDFKIISMLALGRSWRGFSSEQKDEFTKYFSRLIINVYLHKIRGADLNGIKVDYIKAVDVKAKSGSRSDVQTIFHNDGVDIPVVYRMMDKESSGTWMIYDILIEGVSLVANYRDTYKTKTMVAPAIIIKELKAKVENE